MIGTKQDTADEVTRSLCAAVHLDPQLAETLVAEFLAEPRRAISPSPGVRSAPVLREAVTARDQRLTLNTAALICFGLLAVLAPWPALAWSLAALLRHITRPTVIDAYGRIQHRSRGCGVLVFTVAAYLMLASSVLSTTSRALTAGSHGTAVRMALALLLVVVLGGLMVIARYLPWHTAATWFGFATYRPDAGNRSAARRACRRYEHRLSRFAAEDARQAQAEGDQITVYRGSDPFVGPGLVRRRWSAPFPLRCRNAPDQQVPRFTPDELYRRIAAEVGSLRDATYLSPGSRFGDLTITRSATVSAAQLPYASDVRPLLDRLNSWADPVLHPPDWERLANSSSEWLRHYQVYRVHSWAQQLVVSGYLHIGCEERTLYIEWHGFVLPPVEPRFRIGDSPPGSPAWYALRYGSADLALFPVTLPRRISDIARILGDRALPRKTTWSTPTEADRIFGAAYSIREYAAGKQSDHTFQNLDSDRYLKVLERRILDAVHRFLDERDIHAQGFDEMVTQINNSTIFHDSNVIAGNIGGESNTGTIGAGMPGSESGGV